LGYVPSTQLIFMLLACLKRYRRTLLRQAPATSFKTAGYSFVFMIYIVAKCIFAVKELLLRCGKRLRAFFCVVPLPHLMLLAISNVAR
jgi:hypothetical protein